MIDPNEIEIEWVDADPFDDMIDVIASIECIGQVKVSKTLYGSTKRQEIRDYAERKAKAGVMNGVYGEAVDSLLVLRRLVEMMAAAALLEDKAIEGQSLAIIDELVGAMTLPEDEQGDA